MLVFRICLVQVLAEVAEAIRDYIDRILKNMDSIGEDWAEKRLHDWLTYEDIPKDVRQADTSRHSEA